MLPDETHVVMMGDFNIDLLETSTVSTLHNYTQLINDSTTRNATLLDHIYIKNLPPQYDYGIIETYYGYHDAIFYSFTI